MPVSLGAKPQHSFNEPLGMLSDCHRRIENFLGVFQRVVRSARGGELDEQHRQALTAATRYFEESAPRHTADEEESLFPRMRAVAKTDDRVREALKKLDALEADHQVADRLQEEMLQWGARWLQAGTLSTEQTQRMTEVIESLMALYSHHIQVEDKEVFPLAAGSVDAAALEEVGKEMALRRGVRTEHNR